MRTSQRRRQCTTLVKTSRSELSLPAHPVHFSIQSGENPGPSRDPRTEYRRCTETPELQRPLRAACLREVSRSSDSHQVFDSSRTGARTRHESDPQSSRQPFPDMCIRSLQCAMRDQGSSISRPYRLSKATCGRGAGLSHLRPCPQALHIR